MLNRKLSRVAAIAVAALVVLTASAFADNGDNLVLHGEGTVSAGIVLPATFNLHLASDADGNWTGGGMLQSDYGQMPCDIQSLEVIGGGNIQLTGTIKISDKRKSTWFPLQVI